MASKEQRRRESGGEEGLSGSVGKREELRIESIVAGGDGMARAGDGRVVFVPRTAPGELIEAEYAEEHKQWLRGSLIRTVEAGPDRRDPPCRYYSRCGGCQLQHLDYKAQISAKTSIVTESIRRLGGVDLPVPQAVPSVRELGYRNRVSLIMRGATGGFSAGYHACDDPSEIVDVDMCPLAEPAVNEVWSSLRALWARQPPRLPPGRDLRLTLRASSREEVGLAIQEAPHALRAAGGATGGRPGHEGRGAHREKATEPGPLGAGGAVESGRAGGWIYRGDESFSLVDSVPGLAAVWLLDARGNITSYEGAESLYDRWGPYEVPLAGTAFLQVNRETAARLEEYVREQCGDLGGARVIDAYCGYGLRAMEMAREGARVKCIDSDGRAIAAGAAIAAETGAGARFFAAAVEHTLRRELPADVVVLNPPRRGLALPVTAALASKPPRRAVYVSCNPATLARDLKRLGAKFEVAACKAFDLFPQTAHVETVVTLDRRAG